MNRAGRRSGDGAIPKHDLRRRRFWRAIGVGGTLIAAGAATLLLYKNEPLPTEAEHSPMPDTYVSSTALEPSPHEREIKSYLDNREIERSLYLHEMERQYGLCQLDEFDTRFPGEIDIIITELERTREVYGVWIHPAFIMAIRQSENGPEEYPYGVMHTDAYIRDTQGVLTPDGYVPYESEYKKQLDWTIQSAIKKSKRFYGDTEERWEDGYFWLSGDFIERFGEEWAPVGADNDPEGLNENWIPNVKRKSGHYACRDY